MQDKLAEAEMKRQMKIEERKRKASHMLQKALLVSSMSAKSAMAFHIVAIIMIRRIISS